MDDAPDERPARRPAARPDARSDTRPAPRPFNPSREAPDRRPPREDSDLQQGPIPFDRPRTSPSIDGGIPDVIKPTGDVARDAVMARLLREIRNYPRLSLAPLEVQATDPRDAALAHAIFDAVMRRWVTIERLVAKKCRKPLSAIEPVARAALLAAVAQIVLLDRLPAYAVINHAVEWTKRNYHSSAAGFVNAVLKKIASELDEQRLDKLPADWLTSGRVLPLSDGRAVRLMADVLPSQEDKALAVALGMPAGMFNRFATVFGQETAAELSLHALGQAPIILNAQARSDRGASLPELLESFSDDAATLLAHDVTGHYVFQGPSVLLVKLLEKANAEEPGTLWVQDPASSRSLQVAADAAQGTPAALPGVESILDLCAGQGTKTRQLAAIYPHAKIYATDIDDSRRRTLQQVFAGHPRVTVLDPGEMFTEGMRHRFDLVVCDVP